MVSTKPKGGVRPSKRISAQTAERLLSGAAPTASQSTLSSMAKVIARMGIAIPEQAELPPAMRGTERTESVRVPKFTTTETLMLTLMAAPEQWHLVLRAKTRRANVGTGGLGTCFELATRNENGMVNHYARYTATGTMSAQGHARYVSLQEKLRKIEEAVESGLPISGKGFSRAVNTGGTTAYTDLERARRFAINPQERKFLEVCQRPNTKVLVDDHTTKSSSWHTFRWKWQKYGFDLSQIKIEQKKQDDGTFNIYATCEGIPTGGVRQLIEFLATKPVKRA